MQQNNGFKVIGAFIENKTIECILNQIKVLHNSKVYYLIFEINNVLTTIGGQI